MRAFHTTVYPWTWCESSDSFTIPESTNPVFFSLMKMKVVIYVLLSEHVHLTILRFLLALFYLIKRAEGKFFLFKTCLSNRYYRKGRRHFLLLWKRSLSYLDHATYLQTSNKRSIHWPNFSVKWTFAVKIQVMFSYKILNIKF